MFQTKDINIRIRSSNVKIFCLEHFYTIRYDTFVHTFLCSTTYQKLVFYAGIPLINFEVEKYLNFTGFQIIESSICIQITRH